MRTTLASLVGGPILCITLAGPTFAAQEARPGKSEITGQLSQGPNALLNDVPDLVIAGGVDQDQWFDCLRTIKVTKKQREEITPLVRTYMEQRRAWSLVYAPLLKRTMERRRELGAKGVDVSALTAEIQSIRKRNPRLTVIRREVWNRLDKFQRADLVDILQVVRRANRDVDPDTQRIGAGGKGEKGGGNTPAVGLGGSSPSPAKPAATPSTKAAPAAPAPSPKSSSTSVGKDAESTSPSATPSAEGGSVTPTAPPSSDSKSKAGAVNAGAKKTTPQSTEPVPWSFDD